jgi:hypothetical protein
VEISQYFEAFSEYMNFKREKKKSASRFGNYPIYPFLSNWISRHMDGAKTRIKKCHFDNFSKISWLAGLAMPC